MHLVIWVAKINRVAKIMAHRPNGASRQLQLSRQCQSCCIYMKDIIYDYMLALAAVLAYLQSIWWSVLLFWLLSLPIHGACGGPLQSQGATNDSSAPQACI